MSYLDKSKEEIIRDLENSNRRVNELEAMLSRLNDYIEQLKENEHKYKSLVEQANDGIAIIQDTMIKFANPCLARMVGYGFDEIINMPFDNIVCADTPPRQAAVSQQNIRKEDITPAYEAALRHKDGKKIYVEFNAGVITYKGQAAQLLVVRDISERKRLIEELLHAQKMEIVGRLSGGMAHDFNNLLMAIINYAVIVKNELPSQSSLQDDIEQIILVGKRAAALIRQLLVFSRKHIAQPYVIDVNDVILNMNKMLRHLIREDIELVVIAESNNLFVEADPSHIEQVIINLVINAKDAMPKGGKLAIETGRVAMEVADKNSAGKQTADTYVVIIIKDTGVGMSQDVKKHLFEPFFTTKESGRGTGLGLATVYSLVSSYKGRIDVHSSVGEGTVFKIFFPAAKQTQSAVKGDESGMKLAGGSETILLVEDEPSVRAVTGRMLKKLGYKVLSASHGEEAVNFAKEHKGDIHLVIADMVMPRMSGQEVVKAIRSLRPDVKIIFISGYIDDEGFGAETYDSNTFFLRKPFVDTTLAQKIRHALDAKI